MSKPLPSLKAMAEAKLDGVNKQTQFTVDARLVEFEEGFNGRPIDPEHVAAFKETKRNGGTWPAVTVRVEDGRIIAVDGHHRVTAQLELLAEDKDGSILPGLDAVQFRGNDADRVLLMITSQQGKPMTPLQLGVQYRKMLGFGWKPAQIASRVGKSAQHVNDMIKLAEANSDVQGMVERGEVAAHVALKTVKKHGGKAGKVLAGHLEEAKKTGKKKVTEKVVKKGIGPKEIANAGKAYVAQVADRSAATVEHMRAMLQSPSIEKPVKDAIKTVLNGVFGKASKIKIDETEMSVDAALPHIRDWLQHNTQSTNERIKNAAVLLYMACCGEGLPPPSDLAGAIEAEIDSKGETKAEALCPDHAHLVVYLRATGAK